MDKLLSQLQRDQIITEDQARVVKIESASKRLPVRTVLLQTEFATAAQLSDYQGDSVALPITAELFLPDVNALAMINQLTARRFNVLPVSLNIAKQQLLLAMDDPTNVLARDHVRREVDASISLEFRRANFTDIKKSLDKCYGSSSTLQEVLLELDIQSASQSANAHAEQVPIVRLIGAVLKEAITRRASDIHLSPQQYYIQIRYRIDGVLHDACCLHINYWPAMLVRIKVMSDLDIAETRLPQDGHISLDIAGQSVDFRVASFPLFTGENLVLRVLDRQRGVISLEALCSDAQAQNTLRKMVQRPSGLVLVCGPTGSGKTTTLYALLGSLDAATLNIMTLEDPVEYPMLNIRQTRVNGGAAFGFAEGVRGVLRQDPDVILVGEVRDADSCLMTCRAAMTGHLVLTSTHADDCIGAIARLLELGAERSVIANVLAGVVAQRLIRKLCVHCQNNGSACGVCGGTGYCGRIALYESLTITNAFSSLLNEGAPLLELHQQAEDDGLVALKTAAQNQLQRGLTTVEELQRVFGFHVASSSLGKSAVSAT